MTATNAPSRQQPRNLHSARRAVVVGVVLGAVIVGAGYPFLGSIAVSWGALFAVSFVPWRLTTYGRPADPRSLVVPYLVTVMLFFGQICEEYLSKTWDAYTRIGQPMTERTFIFSAATVVPIFWLLGLLLLCLRTEIGNWMAWAFAVAMGFVQLSVLIFPFMDTGHFGYFSGLYSALLLMPAGWYLTFRIYRAC